MLTKTIVSFLVMCAYDMVVLSFVLQMLPRYGINSKEMPLSEISSISVRREPRKVIGLLVCSLLAIAGFICGLVVFMVSMNILQ